MYNIYAVHLRSAYINFISKKPLNSHISVLSTIDMHFSDKIYHLFPFDELTYLSCHTLFGIVKV